MSNSLELHALQGRGTAGAIIQSATNPKRVYAGTGSGVNVSFDGGHSWNSYGHSMQPTLVEALACARSADDQEPVLAGGAMGLFRSRDHGESWTAILNTVHVRALAALPAHKGGSDSSVVLAGTEADGVLRSENGGESWTTSNPGLLDRTVLSLATILDGEDRVIALAGTVSGVYLSRNAGRAWRPVFISEEGGDVESIAAVSRPDGGWTAFATSSMQGLLRSDDGGLTWNIVDSFPGSGSALIAVLKSNDADQYLAVSADRDIFLSVDEGSNWELAGTFANPIMSLSALAGDELSGTLLAGPSDGGIVRYDPVSRRWSPSDSGLTAGY